MKNNLHLVKFSKITVLLAGLFCFFSATAQYEDKSYLKKGQPDKVDGYSAFIPSSKYGEVVTPYNLPEALKNPELYKSARFNSAGLTEFPEQLFLFPNLEEIDVSRNSISVLPANLNQLKNLKELHVNRNNLTTLGIELISCNRLEVLQIQNNPLQTITKEIGIMSSLNEITLGEMAPECLIPIELWMLTNLKKIKITNAGITEIPAEIGQLQQLTDLCLTNNSISVIPEEIFLLKNIQYLNLGNNKITVIPASINKLQNLNYLGIYYNPIKSFPGEINSLTNLVYLSCWKTGIPQNEIENVRTHLSKTKVHEVERDLH